MSDWMDDPERFVKPDPFVEGRLVISDRDPGDENDNEEPDPFFPCHECDEGGYCTGGCDEC